MKKSIRNQRSKGNSSRKAPNWIPYWLGGVESQPGAGLMRKQTHSDFLKVNMWSTDPSVFSISAWKSGNGQQQMEGFLWQAAFIYVWRLPLVWVSTSHLHLNNPFAVNGCTTHNTFFVFKPPESSLPVCPLPVHFYGDDQHNSSLQRHPNLVERVAFLYPLKMSFSWVIEN